MVDEVLSKIWKIGLIAVIRLMDDDHLDEVIESLISAGATVMEITTTVPGAIGHISRCVKELGDEATIGCGTVKDGGTAVRAIEAGAEFVVSPVLQEEMLKVASSRGVLAIPAAFGPTEIWRAHSLGADAVKLFPARALGPGYVRDVLGPIPEIQIIPAGGVDSDNASSYIKAGAKAIFSGSSIVSDRKLREGGTNEVEESAREMLRIISEAREEVS